MIITIVPGFHHGGGGDGDVRVHVGDGDGGAGFQPGPGGGLGGQPAGFLAQRDDGAGHLFIDDVLQARVEGFEERLGREAFALGPDGLVTGGAGVALFLAGQLPDDPVGGFEEALGGGVDFGVFVEDLPDLGEEPFGADLTAVAVEESRSPSRGRSR